MATALLRRTSRLELGDLRVAGALMLAAGAARPMLGNPGLPCPLRSLTGIPCPLCGMTTSVTDTVHTHIGAALAANPAGVIVVVAALSLLALRHLQTVQVPVWLAPSLLGAMWAFELFRYHVL